MEENKINIGGDYELSTKNENIIINPHEGKILEQESPEMTAIRFAAQTMGIDNIKTPDENCPHCYGRGYRGKLANSGQPIPCTCIYPDEVKKTMNESITAPQFVNMNRKQRRQAERNMKRMLKKIK